MGEGEILCFGHRGTKRWSFRTGQERTYGDSVYSPDYRIRGIGVHDLDGDGKLEVLAFALQMPEWPCQFLLFDCEGIVLGEYWNGGHITDYAFSDLNGDGREEIIITGVYNERQTGFLAVFDTSQVSGGSPQQHVRYTSREIAPGSEKYYVLLPRPDVNLINFSNEAVGTVKILQNGRIQARATLAVLLYEFDSKLRALEVKDSHIIIQLHKELAAQGLVKSVLNDAYYENLRKSVLYWDGARKRFTTQWAMANPW